jgi:hypothetical protein
MLYFRCLVRGENFPGELISKKGMVGFYTIRYVAIENPEDVETVVVDMLRSDPRLIPTGDVYVGYSLARVYVEELTEIDVDEFRSNMNITPGFSWFSMNEV